MTVKAARLIAAADVIAYHPPRPLDSPPDRGTYLRGDQIEEALVYLVTTEATDHPGGYQAAIDEFYAEAAERLAAHLDAGRDVVVLAEGDPLFYGSYMHMHKRLAHRYPTEVVPGVTSISGASAALSQPLVERDEVLTVLPGTLSRTELARRLADTDSAAVLKLGRTFPAVLDAVGDAGRTLLRREGDDAGPAHRSARRRRPRLGALLRDRAAARSTRGVPARTARSRACRPGRTRPPAKGGRGRRHRPRRDDWLTPQVAAALAAADDLVGYGPYLARVPPNPGRTAIPATTGSRRAPRTPWTWPRPVARSLVSGGDPGVFAMAAALLEVASEEKYVDVPVRVLPAVTASSAAAAGAAPLGHDHAVISLSDRLKPGGRRREAGGRGARGPGDRHLQPALGGAALAAGRRPRPAAGAPRPRHSRGAGPRRRRRRRADRGDDAGGAGSGPVDMRTLVIVGSSTTRVVRRNGRDVVFTPRRYGRVDP